MIIRILIILGLMHGLFGCATIPEPSSLNPQPTLIFDFNKDGRRLYVLNDEFPYCDRNTGEVYVVPKGFVTDFASVPSVARGIIEPEGPAARAAIIHDWLYAVGEAGARDKADALFYRSMKYYGVDEIKARLAYQAVRIGGEKGYGLSSDWWFLDPKNPQKPLVAPLSKPKTARLMVLKSCEGFEAMISRGYKAYGKKSRFSHN
jgi:hypothetical protein